MSCRLISCRLSVGGGGGGRLSALSSVAELVVVSGHEFTRAERDANHARALAPANIVQRLKPFALGSDMRHD